MAEKPVDEGEMVFPFADTPAIVRSQQKDAYYEQHLAILLQDIIKTIKGGNRFLVKYSSLLAVISKLLYLSVTTLSNKRTLGEQYVDLLYVEEKSISKNRKVQKLASIKKKFGFVIVYCLFPVVIDKLVKKFKMNDDDDDDDDDENHENWKLKLLKLLKFGYTLIELNLAIFYLTGKYYTLSKRFFNLRYIFGHQVSENDNNNSAYSSSLGYKILGTLMILKIFLNNSNLKNWLSLIRQSCTKQDHISSITKRDENNRVYDARTAIEKSSSFASSNKNTNLNLANSKKLPFLNNRSCMLCLNDMKDPTCLKCGHVSCWNCIMSWCQDNSNGDCPLCRMPIDKQFIPIK